MVTDGNELRGLPVVPLPTIPVPPKPPPDGPFFSENPTGFGN